MVLGFPEPNTDLEAGEEIARRLRLHPLPREGGLFRETHRDARSSSIYFMLLDGMVSAIHRLDGMEVYHWYAGAPLRMLLLHPDGRVEQPVLGPDIAGGQQPQIHVPAGVWQGSSSAGEWTLMGTTMAPPFEWTELHMGIVDELVARYPKVATRIRALTPMRESSH
jgi:predicted cupin superfamily sugar epimerase